MCIYTHILKMCVHLKTPLLNVCVNRGGEIRTHRENLIQSGMNYLHVGWIFKSLASNVGQDKSCRELPIGADIINKWPLCIEYVFNVFIQETF